MGATDPKHQASARRVTMNFRLTFGIWFLAPVTLPGWTFNDLKTRQVESDKNLKWVQVAPGMDGSNRRIHADSVDPNKVWVTPDMGNDYLTTDGGKHWESVIPHDGTWSNRQELSDELVISDPKNPDVVISLVKNGWWERPTQQIEFSEDGGRTFTPIRSYSSGSEPNSAWFCAAPHPVEAGTWYVANGINVMETRTGANPNPVDSIDTSQPKVWKITDITESSRTITAIPNDGMDHETSVFDVLCHPDTVTYPDMLFAATSTGIYRRDNASAPWIRIFDGYCKMDAQWDGSTYTLYALRQSTYTVSGNTISSSGGVFVSTSPETAALGSGWIDKTNGLQVDLTQLSIPVNRFRTFIKKWFDYTGGEEASFVLPANYFPNFVEIRCDPTNPDRVYLFNSTRTNFVSMVTGGVWASMDGGDSWFAAARLGTGFQNHAYWASRQPGRLNRNIAELQVHENNYPDYWTYDIRGCRSMTMGADGTVYASISKGYFTVKYDADADLWTSIDNTVVGHEYFGHGNGDLGAYAVIPDIHRPGEMFLLQQEASVWKTTGGSHTDYSGVVGVSELPGLIDQGSTWAPGSPFIVPTALAQHPTDPDTFYFLSPRRGNFSKSSDNGLSFVVKGEPIFVPDGTSLVDTIYWRNLRIAENAAAIYAVAEVVDNDNYPMGQIGIFNHSARKGVYKSTDDGVTWTNVNNGLPVTAAGREGGSAAGSDSACVKGLAMDPENSEILYAAAKRYLAPVSGYTDGGLYRTSDGASQWVAEGIPPGIKSLWDVWLHVENDTAQKIFIAGGGDGSESDWGEGGLWVAKYKPNGGYRGSDWTKIFDHPFCSHVTTSPFDDKHILLATRETGSIDDLNQGTFLTLTGGTAGDGSDWMKINYGRGPMPISDIAFDNGNPDRLWVSAAASGSFSTLIPYRSFSSWIEEHELLDSDAAYDADPDEDSLSNLLEYALGTNPKRWTDFRDTIRIRLADDKIEIVYKVLQKPTGEFNFQLQWSENLQAESWVNSGYAVASTRDSGAGMMEVVRELPIDSGKKFIRLLVERAER